MGRVHLPPARAPARRGAGAARGGARAGERLNPVLLSAGAYDVYAGPVFSGFAALAAFAYVRSRRASLRLSDDDFWGLILGLAAGVGLGAVGLHFALSGRFDGGSYLGALFGSAAAAALFCRGRGLALAPVADALAAAAPLGLAVQRVGCLLNGCCHGLPTARSWGLAFSDPRGAVPAAWLGVPLHPTQLYEGAGALAILLVLRAAILPRIASRALAPGTALACSLALYAALRFVVDFFRAGEPGASLAGLSPSQVLSALALAGVASWSRAGRLDGAAARRLAVLGLIAAVAWRRRDLVGAAWGGLSAGLAAGGVWPWLAVADLALLAGVLAAAVWAVARGGFGLPEAVAVGAASWAGFVAEAWGTRSGVWSYYTGERPPLWIVPAWPLGALVVRRAADAARARWGGAPGAAAIRTAYRAMAALCLAVFAAFTRPWHADPGTLAMAALVLAALAAPPSDDEDAWLLGAGLVCVFFADLWGTVNGCWTYHAGGGARGLADGIAFGMAYDSAVVLGCWKLARAVSAWRSPEGRLPGRRPARSR